MGITLLIAGQISLIEFQDSLRKALADRSIKSISQDALNSLLNLLPNLSDYASKLDIRLKVLRPFKAETLADLYHVLLSLSGDYLQMLLAGVKSQELFLAKLQPKFPDFNNPSR